MIDSRKAAAAALASVVLVTSPGPWAAQAFAQALRPLPLETAPPLEPLSAGPLQEQASPAPLEALPALGEAASPLSAAASVPLAPAPAAGVQAPRSPESAARPEQASAFGQAALSRTAPIALPLFSRAARAESAEGSRGELDRALAELLSTSRASAPELDAAPVLAAPEAVAAAPMRRTLRYGRYALAAASAGAAAALAPHAAAGAVVSALGLVASVLLHEVAHLWALRKLGDDTALKHGAFSLNPLRRVDPLGTIALPLATLALSMSLWRVPILVGWAKPVPVDFNRLHDRKRDTALSALAGPAVNLALAAAAGLAALAAPASGWLHASLASTAAMNLLMGLFNLLPLPNLDGGKIFVGALPRKAYEWWTHNPRLPDDMQAFHRRIYEGPARILTALRLDGQAAGNVAAWAATFGALAGAYAAFYSWLHPPLLFLVLPCSYFYYCIREKTQSQEAVDELVGILDDFASGMAELAESDDSIKSEVNVETIRTVAGNALEDAIDKAVASEGFAELSEDEKYARLESIYKEDLVKALQKNGLQADDEATIRRMLDGEKGRAYFSRLREWTRKYKIFERWKDPRAKSKEKTAEAKDKKSGSGGGGLGGKLLSIAVPLAFLAGQALLGPGGGLSMGEKAELPKGLTFAEAIERPEAGINPKERDFLKLFLKEMKIQDKPPVIGRSEELRKLVKKVTAPRGVPSSVVLVGEAGVGKTAVVEKLAQALRLADERPDSPLELQSMKGRLLLELDVNELLNQKDPVGTLAAILQLLPRLNDNDPRTGNRAILFIDEIHAIFQSADGDRIANLLKKPLRDGGLSLVAATTTKEYKKYMENDDAFRRRLFKIDVAEPTVEETVRMLEGARAYYEDLLGVRFTDSAQRAAAEASRFDQENHLPDKAFVYWRDAARSQDPKLQLDEVGIKLEETLSRLAYVARLAAGKTREGTGAGFEGDLKDAAPVELYNALVGLSERLASLYAERDRLAAGGAPLVTDEHVKAEVASATGVRSGQLTLGGEDTARFLEMPQALGRKVLGQPEAIAAISQAIQKNKAGLSDPDRPMGVFFLTGPTGTGKTHLARALAEFLFGDPEAIVRLDMTEYQEGHQVARLIGSPPGYVGFEAGGQLTEKIRRRPYGVILLDEIEKAHPAVFDILLQIFDAGRLTDGQGRTVDFKNTVILMTSNLGMGEIDLSSYKRAAEEIGEAERKLRATGQLTEANAAELARQRKALAEKLQRETRQKAVQFTELAMRERFRPEFKGRIDEVLVFNRISREIGKGIVELNLRDLARTLARAGHKLEWDDAAVEKLTDVGFDVELGARPLKQAIQREISGPLSRKILEASAAGKMSRTSIRLSAGTDGIVLAVSPRPEEPPERAAVEEGGGRRIFERVFERVLRAASGETGFEWTAEAMDGLARHSLSSGTGAPAAGSAAAGPAGTPSAPSLLAADVPAPLEQPVRLTTAAHGSPGTKDPSLRAANRAIEEAMREAGFDEPSRAAAAAWLAPGDETLGFVKLFTEHAKSFSPPSGDRPVELAWSLGAGGLTIAVRRAGGLTPQEREKLEEHFSGPATAGRQASFERTERRNLTQQALGRPADGVQSLFELHRALGALPGAVLGFAATDSGVEYWLRLPPPDSGKPLAANDNGSTESAVPPAGAEKIRPAPGLDSSKAFIVKFRAEATALAAREVLQRHQIAHPQVLRRPEGQALKVRAEFDTAANAARIAADVAAEEDVEAVFVPQETLERLGLGSSPQAPPPAAARPEARGPEGRRAKFRNLLVALIDQGESRGSTLRDAAAGALADVSAPADLQLAREWIRETSPSRDFAKLAAAALILSKHGAPEDLDRMAAAGARYQSVYSHALNPSRDMISEALAARLAPQGEGGLERLRETYRQERERSSKNDALIEAAYRALARAGDASDLAVLKVGMTGPRLPEYYRYLARTRAGELDEYVQTWRRGGELEKDEKALAELRVAETGTESDLSRLLADIDQERTGYLDLSYLEIRARAFALLVARRRAFGRVEESVRRWLDGDLSESTNFCRMLAGVLTVGAAGGEADLALLERIMRVEPSDSERVHNYHEMTQHEAAIAWAAVAHRAGPELAMSQPRDERGMPGRSRLERMMLETNPLFNLAAIETYRLFLRPPAEPFGREL